ncbi:MAG: NAD(P)-dependent oxidoreductase [Sphingomonas sp.]|jgi:uroporphyrin-III C-methyltransferase/precorrin-2 dehydrogenase/sirohydrochlorin ferrochelatase
MSLHSLPLFVRLAGKPFMLLGTGTAADAKRRLLARAGAVIVGEEDADARLAIVACEDEDEALAAVARLRARGLLVNAVDRPALCDFTLPAIIERAPVLIAIGTGGASAGLAAAVRQRLEGVLPASLGALALALANARAALRKRWPDMGERRRALATALGAGGALDPLGEHGAGAVDAWLQGATAAHAVDMASVGTLVAIALRSEDAEELTLREARLLALADRVYHQPNVPSAVLMRARADAEHIVGAPGPDACLPGLSVWLEMAR